MFLLSAWQDISRFSAGVNRLGMFYEAITLSRKEFLESSGDARTLFSGAPGTGRFDGGWQKAIQPSSHPALTSTLKLPQLEVTD